MKEDTIKTGMELIESRDKLVLIRKDFALDVTNKTIESIIFTDSNDQALYGIERESILTSMNTYYLELLAKEISELNAQISDLK